MKYWNAKTGVKIDEALENLNIMTTTFLFYNDHSRYKDYRNRIVNKPKKFILYDIFFRCLKFHQTLLNIGNNLLNYLKGSTVKMIHWVFFIENCALV